jgi:HTH-like domain
LLLLKKASAFFARELKREQGLRIGRYRVRTLMREAGLRTSWKRKFVSTTTAGIRYARQRTCSTGSLTWANPFALGFGHNV